MLDFSITIGTNGIIDYSLFPRPLGEGARSDSEGRVRVFKYRIINNELRIMYICHPEFISGSRICKFLITLIDLNSKQTPNSYSKLFF